MRFRTLLEQQVDEWEDGYGVVQIVTPESEEANHRCTHHRASSTARAIPLTTTIRPASQHFSRAITAPLDSAES